MDHLGPFSRTKCSLPLSWCSILEKVGTFSEKNSVSILHQEEFKNERVWDYILIRTRVQLCQKIWSGVKKWKSYQANIADETLNEMKMGNSPWLSWLPNFWIWIYFCLEHSNGSCYQRIITCIKLSYRFLNSTNIPCSSMECRGCRGLWPSAILEEMGIRFSK